MTNTIKLYHGTNHEATKVIDTPTMNNATNGLGFYLTECIDTAKSYGSNVVCFELELDIVNSMNMVIRPISPDNPTREWVITNTKDLNTLTLDNWDAYEL